MNPVAKQLSDQEIEDAIRAATKPYDCEIDTRVDFGNQIKFMVFLPDDKKLPFNEDGTSSRPDTAASLNAVLLETRRRIKKLGHQLESWEQLPRQSYIP